VLEIRPADAVIVACFGSPEALDGAPDDLGSLLRVAPDEVWVMGPRTRRAQLLAVSSEWLAIVDGAGVAVDQTDGWAIWAVRGPRVDDLFGRLSVSPLPGERPALVQGALSGVPGKVVFADDATYYMVPSPAGHHLRDRMLETGDDLGATVAPAEPFVAAFARLPAAAISGEAGAGAAA
jgi:hypothetical protein